MGSLNRAGGVRHVPAEEVCVLGMLDETSPHHDGLETQSIYRPELDVSQGQRCAEKQKTYKMFIALFNFKKACVWF